MLFIVECIFTSTMRMLRGYYNMQYMHIHRALGYYLKASRTAFSLIA